MADNVKEEMNSTESCVPVKWNRKTVADGEWLQKYTLDPLMARDDFLAERLDSVAPNLDSCFAEISSVSSLSDANDAYLSGSLDYVSATMDTISGEIAISAESLKESISLEEDSRRRADEDLRGRIDLLEAASDVVMVYGTHAEFETGSASLHLTDKDVVKVLFDETVSSNQVYYEYALETDEWSKIGELEPYYSVGAMDDKLSDLSSTVAKGYLSANSTDISAGKNLDVTIQSKSPRVTFKTKDDVSFDSVSSTLFSGSSIVGENTESTIDGLIASAEEGCSMTAIKNISQIRLTNISSLNNWTEDDYQTVDLNTSADTLNFYVSGGASEWLNVVPGLNPSGVCLSGDYLENYLQYKYISMSADYANVASTTQNTYTATDNDVDFIGDVSAMKLSAGEGITFTSGDDGALILSSRDTTYSAGDYIDISDGNGIFVSDDLVGSAQSGQSAYDWLTTKSATLSAGFGINFTSAGQNAMGVELDASLDSNGKISAIDGKELVGADGVEFIGSVTGPKPDYLPLSGKITAVSAVLHDSENGVSEQGITYGFKDEDDTEHTLFSVLVPSGTTSGQTQFLRYYRTGDGFVSYAWETLSGSNGVVLKSENIGTTISLSSSIDVTNVSATQISLSR